MCAVHVKNIIAKIKLLSNKKNVGLMINYYNYLIDKGIVERSQINSLQPVYYFAKYLGDSNLMDVKEKIHITTFLNTKIKNDDLEKNIFLHGINT